MPEHFDPYHKWLGIPPEEQPANHYRLLGITLFEDDLDVIRDAAEQRMAHVRTYQLGKYSELSQKILNELAAARVCLLDPDKKAAYGATLKQQIASAADSTKPPPVPPPVQFQPSEPLSSPPLPPPVQHHSSTPSYLFRVGQTMVGGHRAAIFRQKLRPWLFRLPIVAAIVIYIGVMAFILSGGSSKKVADSDSDGTSEPKAAVSEPPAKPPASPSSPDPVVQKNHEVESPKEEPKTATGDKATPEAELPVDLPENGPPEPSSPVDPPKPVDQPNPSASLDSPKPVDQPKPSASLDPPITSKPKAADKAPVPSDAAQKQALGLVHDLYKDDYASAKTPELKTALAQNMIQKAAEARNDAVARFVLLQEATNVASEAMQIALAFQAIDKLASEYDVSASEMKADVVEKVAKLPGLSSSEKIAAARIGLQVIDDAIAEDNYEVANKLAVQISRLARASRNVGLIEEITATRNGIEDAEKAYRDAKTALAVLEKDPLDADANLAVGRYYCLIKGDWQKGLEMLLVVDDPTLSWWAQKDLEAPTAAKDRMDLGDAWWEIGSKQRAAYWYEQALPTLRGADKSRAEERLADFKLLQSRFRRSVQPGQLSNQGGKNDWRVFVGEWVAGNPINCTFILNDDFSARRITPTVRSSGVWKCVNGAVYIDWNDGWQDVFRRQGNNVIKFAFAPGTPLDGASDHIEPVVKKEGAVNAPVQAKPNSDDLPIRRRPRKG